VATRPLQPFEPTQLHNAAMDDLPPLPANLDWELPTSRNLEALRKRTESSKAGSDSEHRSLHTVRWRTSRSPCRPRASVGLTTARHPCNGTGDDAQTSKRRPARDDGSDDYGRRRPDGSDDGSVATADDGKEGRNGDGADKAAADKENADETTTPKKPRKPRPKLDAERYDDGGRVCLASATRLTRANGDAWPRPRLCRQAAGPERDSQAAPRGGQGHVPRQGPRAGRLGQAHAHLQRLGARALPALHVPRFCRGDRARGGVQTHAGT